MAIEKPSPDLYCIVYHRDENYGEKYGFTTIKLCPFDHVHNTPDYAKYGDVYGQFVLTSQYDTSGDTCSQSYAWYCGFAPKHRDMLTLQDVENYGPYLRAIQRKYDKLCNDFGYPASFGQYVIYLMQAVGIKQYAYKSTQGWWYCTDCAGDARHHIDQHIAAWHDKHDKKDITA